MLFLHWRISQVNPPQPNLTEVAAAPATLRKSSQFILFFLLSPSSLLLYSFLSTHSLPELFLTFSHLLPLSSLFLFFPPPSTLYSTPIISTKCIFFTSFKQTVRLLFFLIYQLVLSPGGGPERPFRTTWRVPIGSCSLNPKVNNPSLF